MSSKNDRKRILVIEDEPDMLAGLREVFEFEGFEVTTASEGGEGIRLSRRIEPDLIIIDLMLPDVNGYEVTRSVRASSPLVPIIILTAKSQESDKVRGFDSGADDYVTKPFSVAELLARVRAVFRRTGQTLLPQHEVIKVGSAEIDPLKHTLTKNRKEHAISFYELEIVKLLDERRGDVVSRDNILEKIWGLQASPTNRTVDNFIVKLRRKIEDKPDHPQHILTVYGQGYKLI